MKVVKNILFVLGVFLGLIVGNALLCFARYNLYEGGIWDSGKTHLEKGVWGGWAMMLTNSGLKGGMLNVNAWHGNQEIMLNKGVSCSKFEFDFKNDKALPFSVIVNKTDSITIGVLLNSPLGLYWYKSDRDGRFVFKSNVINGFKYKKGGKILLCYGKEQVDIFFDNEKVLSIPEIVSQTIKPGFRGGSEGGEISIDNIQIWGKYNNLLLKETFTFPFRIQHSIYILAFVCLILTLFILTQKTLFVFFSNVLIIVDLVLAIFFCFYYYFGSGRYTFDANAINWHGISSNIETQKDVEQRVLKQYPIKETKENKRVVLLLGSSQTWGAGASSEEKTFSAILQNKLQHELQDTNVVVINVGVSATNTSTMIDDYMHLWINYRPIVTVMNVSNNDFDTTLFSKNLKTFIAFNQFRGIVSLLVEEPNYTESRELALKHNIMKRIAIYGNVKSVSMQLTMESNQENGFLWWDAVHMTNYGQAIFAERLNLQLYPLLLASTPGHNSSF